VGGGRNRNGYIGKLRDIDSFLNFGKSDEHAEDKEEDKDKDTDSDDDSDSSTDSNDTRTDKRNKNNRRRSSTVTKTRLSVSPSARQTTPGGQSDDATFIGDTEDIDDILGNDLVTTYLGVILSVPQLERPRNLSVGVGPHSTLRLNTGASSRPSIHVDISSTESLLDTPVPDTPDIPLSPSPAFFPLSPIGGKDIRKSASFDHLNQLSVESMFNKPLQKKGGLLR